MLQMFSIGERSGLQEDQFSTWTLLWWSHAVATAAVWSFTLSCWNTQGFPWNRRRLERSICSSKTFRYFSTFIVSSKTCKQPILMHSGNKFEMSSLSGWNGKISQFKLLCYLCSVVNKILAQVTWNSLSFNFIQIKKNIPTFQEFCTLDNIFKWMKWKILY